MSRLLGVAVVTLLAGAAHAENMQTAGSLGAGQLALGFEAQAGFTPGTNPFTLNLHQAVGLRGGFDLFAREGISLAGNGGTYIGAGIKWTFLSSNRSRPGVAALFGGHYVINNYGGADVSLLIDYTISSVTPYIGLDSNIDFYDDGADFKLGLIGGARIAVVSHVAWFVEGGIGITGAPKPHFISTGPKITF